MPRSVKSDWSRPLTKPISVGRRKLRTLSDVRAHLLTLPEDRANRPTWQHVAETAIAAAEDGDVKRTEVAFYFARQFE